MAQGCESTHGNPFRYCSCGWMEGVEVKVDPDQFLKKAKKLVEVSEFDNLKKEDLFIVWFVKALGNWKALISTDKVDGLYWEVTYNGTKNEAYVDRYQKQANVAITDELLQEVTA